MSYVVKYGNMHATALTPEWHEKTCGYWYTVTSGATAHTAFATKSGLERWLSERGLTLDGTMPEERGEYATMRVIGEYRTESHGEFAPTEEDRYRMIEDDEWHNIKPIVITATLSNGRYTLALIDEQDGVRTVHTLNCNVKTRLTAADNSAMRERMS